MRSDVARIADRLRHATIGTDRPASDAHADRARLDELRAARAARLAQMRDQLANDVENGTIPGHLRHALGDLPTDPDRRAIWLRAAHATQVYRETWRVASPLALGAEPDRDDVRRHTHYRAAADHLAAATTRLGHDPHELGVRELSERRLLDLVDRAERARRSIPPSVTADLRAVERRRAATHARLADAPPDSDRTADVATLATLDEHHRALLRARHDRQQHRDRLAYDLARGDAATRELRARDQERLFTTHDLPRAQGHGIDL